MSLKKQISKSIDQLSPFKQISIENFNTYEQKYTVNTPRSLYACESDGIDPKELLFKPLSEFWYVSGDSEVQKMHFEFFENKRLQLIQKVKEIKSQQQQDEVKFIYKLDKRSVSSTPSNRLFHSMQSSPTLASAQTKHLRLLENILKNEEMMNNKYEESKKKYIEREQKIEEQRKRRKELEKEKQQKVKIKEKKKKQVIERAEKQVQKAAEQLIQKAAKSDQRLQEKERSKLKELEKIKQEHEQRLMEKILSAQQNIIMQDQQRLNKYTEKQQKDQIVMNRIENKKSEKHQKGQLKRTQSEKKLLQVLNQKSRQKEFKRNTYINHQIGLEEKYNKILQQKQQISITLRQRSQSRDAKILETREKEKQQLEERKSELLERQSKAFEKVKKQREISERKFFLQQQQRKLKALNKQVNIIRQHRREDFKIKNYKVKAREINNKISFYQKEKNKIMLERLRLSTENTLQRIQIKETLRNMAITKKFNISKVQVFIQEKYIHSKQRFISASKYQNVLQKCEFKSF